MGKNSNHSQETKETNRNSLKDDTNIGNIRYVVFLNNCLKCKRASEKNWMTCLKRQPSAEMNYKEELNGNTRNKQYVNSIEFISWAA